MRFLVSSPCLLALTFFLNCGTAPPESASPTPTASIAPSPAKPTERGEWRVYTPPDKSFSVELPCEATRTNVSASSTPIYEYSCGGEDTAGLRFFLVSVINLADSERAKMGDAAAFERSIRESFTPNKRIVKMTPLNVEGGIGREVFIHNTRDAEDLSRGRIIIAGGRQYEVAYVAGEAKALESPEAERFFASFKPLP